MKFFIVVDSNAQPIYHNHPDKLVCHPLWAAHQFFAHNFQEALTSVICIDGTRFALEKFDLIGDSYFLALVVTDEGETEPFLRSQLHLAKELLFLECGPQGLTNSTSIPLPGRRISSIIGTMTRLCSLRQSFLVQANEELLAHSISTNVNDSITSILAQRTESHSNIRHAFICVGTKIVSVYKKQKTQKLSSQDVFLLILLYSSHFEPYHLPKQAANGSIDEQYASIHHPLEITSQVLKIGSKYHLIELCDSLEAAGVEGVSPQNYSIELIGPIINALKRVLVHANLHDGPITNEFDPALTLTLKRLQQEYQVDPASGQICLATLKAIVRHVINPSLPKDDEFDDECNLTGSPPLKLSTKHKNANNSASPSSLRARLGGNPVKEEEEPLSELEEAIIALRYLIDDRPKVTDEEMNVERVYQTSYLSSNGYKPGTLYFARFMDRITLVLLSSSTQENEAEKKSMMLIEQQVKDDLMASYGTYILSMENSYTMVAYMHQLPGLVHFIFVDRSANKFIAPEITTLGGQITVPQIKKHVWHLCYQATEFLSRGALEMVQQNGPFQYSYKMLFVDSNGVAHQPKEQRIIEPKTPVTRGFYKKLAPALFPGNHKDLRCYELFCLYIGPLSLKVIQKHNETLHTLLTK